MEVISSKSFEENSSTENNDLNTYERKTIQNMTEEEDDEEFENNLNQMEMNGINEINELDEEEEESENKIGNDNIPENYEENEISNSVQNVENNTINTIDEENDENSNNNENNEIGDCNPINKQNIQMPYVMPLIYFEGDKYIINIQAKKLLEQIGNNKMSIISLLNNDKYQNDKFNVLNKLIRNIINSNNYMNLNIHNKNNKNNIIIYTKPLIIKNNNYSNNEEELPCFIIDIINLNINTENNDSKIFLIMILISSIFLFISKDIDQDSFNYFNFILNLIKTIKIRNITEEENYNELNTFLPNLFWILLNSNLKMEDNNGNTITEKQYMESCLTLINSSNDYVEDLNKIKMGIKNYFKERDCFTLMNNFDIFSNNINEKNLKNKLFKKIKPKNFFGHLLTGNMILELIESVLNCINEGGSPIMYNSWKYIMKKEFLKYANNLINKFSSELQEYRNENSSNKKFFDENQIEKFKSKIFEKYLKEYLSNTIINEETKLEFKEKIKSKLDSEFHKYEKENEKYFEEKFIKELNLLSNKFMENFTSSDIYEKNSYKFFQDFEDFREIAVQKTPDFPKKNEILFDKVLLIIKKFINGKIMKIKVINEEKTFLEKENNNQDNKINELNKELNLIKSKNYEFIQKINNEIKIEKRKNKRIEEKMNRLINNKTKEIENLKHNIEYETSNYEKKIKEMLEANKTFEKEIKMKDEQIIVMKMNNDKVSSLYEQKSNFLEREITNWKDKYNLVIKDSLNKQNELNKENIKLKEQNKLLMKKENQNNNNDYNNDKIKNNKSINLYLKDKDINKNNNISNNSISNNNNNNPTIKNKHVKNNINGLMTYIKMNFKDNKNKMLKLDKYFLNKKKQNQETLQEKENKNDNNKDNKEKEEPKNKIPNSNIIFTKDKQNSTPLDSNSTNKNNDFYPINKTSIKKFTISNSSFNSNNIGNNNNIIYSENKYSSKTENLRNTKRSSINTINSGNETYFTNTIGNNTNSNNKNNNIDNNENNIYIPEKLKIKIIKGRIRKDKSGKPYLEYIININYDNIKSWNINRRFNQFTNLYKTLRTISKENFELPKSSNIFTNITAMFSGLSHENKIIQLEKNLKDLTETPEINNSKQLYFFLELNHLNE